jgi:tetratricopeptide (TPR) repeat protein
MCFPETKRICVLLTVAFGGYPMYAQYPGPAEADAVSQDAAWMHSNQGDLPSSLVSHGGVASFDSSTGGWTDSDAFPSADRHETSSVGTISVAELRHRLSRKAKGLLLKAAADLKAGREAQGIAELEKANQEPSAVPYVHGLLGATYLLDGRLPAAVSELEQAVHSLPTAANYSNLGYAHCLMGEIDQGEKELRRALELNPASPQTLYLVGVLLLDNESRNREACRHLQGALGAVREARVALAVCYARSGRTDDADQQVRAYVRSFDQTKLDYWEHWVEFVAAESNPSAAFGLRAR